MIKQKICYHWTVLNHFITKWINENILLGHCSDPKLCNDIWRRKNYAQNVLINTSNFEYLQFNLFLYSKDHAAISTNVLPHVQDKILCEFISFCWCAVMFGIISNIPSEESECIFVSSCLLLGTNFHWIWVKGVCLKVICVGKTIVWTKSQKMCYRWTMFTIFLDTCICHCITIIFWI